MQAVYFEVSNKWFGCYRNHGNIDRKFRKFQIFRKFLQNSANSAHWKLLGLETTAFPWSWQISPIVRHRENIRGQILTLYGPFPFWVSTSNPNVSVNTMIFPANSGFSANSSGNGGFRDSSGKCIIVETIVRCSGPRPRPYTRQLFYSSLLFLKYRPWCPSCFCKRIIVLIELWRIFMQFPQISNASANSNLSIQYFKIYSKRCI